MSSPKMANPKEQEQIKLNLTVREGNETNWNKWHL
jgi:hypothetical protein